MIKLIASDMDGTLLNDKHLISEVNLKAIRAAQERGIHFTIVTGRDYSMVKPFIQENELNCEAIVMNGAEYRDKEGNILESIAIDLDKIGKIAEIMKNNNLVMEIYTANGIYITSSEEETFNNYVKRVGEFNPNESREEIIELVKKHLKMVKPKYISDIKELVNDKVEIYKIMAFHDDIEFMNKLKEQISGLGGLSVASTFPTNIEINNINAQKGIILAKVIEKIGIKKDEVIVLGDSYNDYSMFTEFKNSFAMANAVDEIKEIAAYITDTNYNDGVAKAIYKAFEM